MAIKVKHEGNVTSRIFAASEGGRGKRRAEDAIRLAEIQSRADIAAQDRSTRGGGVSAPSPGSPGAGHAPSGPSGLISPPYGRPRKIPGVPEGMVNKGGSLDPWTMPPETKFTTQQKNEFDRLNQTYEDARASGDFTEDELKELRRQIVAKQAGIQPLPSLKDAPKNPWETAHSRMFTDPETGRRGYLDRDDVPQFFKDETSGSSSAPDPDKFFKRLESARRQLTKMVPDGNGGMVEKPPTNEEAIALIRQEDAAMKSYYDGSAPTAAPPPPGEDPGRKEVKRGSPPNPAQRRQAAKERKEIEDRGQDPDEEYTDMRNPKNGKYVPLRHAMFYKPDGTLNSDEIKRASEYLAHTRGISVEAAEAVLVADIEEVWK